MDKPWDRRDGESAPAYEAFTAYCLMGQGRSIPAVARECIKSVSLLRRWSARWEWIERAAGWDRHQSAIDHKARTRVAVDQAKKWAGRIARYRDGLYRPFRMAVRFAAKVEREADRTGQDPPMALILQSIELVNAARAAAREAIVGFPGTESDPGDRPARLEIPGSDDRHAEGEPDA